MNNFCFSLKCLCMCVPSHTYFLTSINEFNFFLFYQKHTVWDVAIVWQSAIGTSPSIKTHKKGQLKLNRGSGSVSDIPSSSTNTHSSDFWGIKHGSGARLRELDLCQTAALLLTNAAFDTSYSEEKSLECLCWRWKWVANIDAAKTRPQKRLGFNTAALFRSLVPHWSAELGKHDRKGNLLFLH